MNYVFLSYINRSGSTFLVNQFSKLDMFCVCPEADVLFNLLLRYPHRNQSWKGRYIKHILKDKKILQWRLVPEKIETILHSKVSDGEKFLYVLDLFRETYFPESKFIVFKYNFIILLKSYFDENPNSHSFYWIYLQRNPIAIFTSQKHTISPQTGKGMAENVVLFCQQVKALESAFDKIDSQKYLKLTYEELILDFKNTLKLLFAYIEIEPSNAEISSISGKIKEFMSDEYRELHPAIDSPPDSKKLNALLDYLSEFEIYYINQKLPAGISGNRKEPPLFKINFLPHLFVNLMETTLIHAKKKLKDLLFNF